MDKFTVKLVKIIAVDSSKYAYLEVPLAENILLIAGGNVGKSSIINAIRFFFMPSLALKAKADYLAFMTPKKDSDSAQHNQKYFTREQTVEHYFGSRYAKLILEVEHQHLDGSRTRHCQILALGEHYKLKRYLFPGDYQQIKSLFWQFPDDDSGAGQRPEQPIDKQLLVALQQVDKGSIEVKTDETLREHLFTANTLAPSASRFCLFPLADRVSDKAKFSEKCESLFALIKLLYNQNADSLKTVLASKIEKTESAQMRLNFDVNTLLEQHQSFARQQARLDRLEALQPRFAKLQALHQQISQAPALADEIRLLLAALKAEHDRASHQFAAATKQAEPVYQQERMMRERLDEMFNQLKQQEGITKDRQQHFDKIKKVYDHMRPEIDASPADFSSYDILQNLLADLEEKTALKTSFDDAQFRQNTLNSLADDINALQTNIAHIEARISQNEFQLAQQLPHKSQDILGAVNPELLQASPGRTLAAEERAALDGFVALFTPTNQGPQLFDTYFAPAQASPSLESRLSELKDQLFDKQNEKARYTLADNPLQRADDRNTLTKKIDETTALVKLFQDYPNIQVQHEQALEALAEAEALEEKAKAQHNMQKELHQQALSTLQTQQQTLQDLDALVRQRDAEIKRLDRRSEFAILAQHEGLPDPHGVELNNERLAEAYQALAAIKDHFAQLGDIIVTEYIMADLIDDIEDLAAGRTDEKLLSMYAHINTQYASLNEVIAHLQDDVREHNRQIMAGMERLAKANDKIDQAAHDINHELALGEFNDLSGVRLTVRKHPQFTSLINAWRDFDSLSANLMETRWYQQLSHVMQSNLVEQGVIVLKNTIAYVGYETKEGDAPWTDKSQSNSTTMLINVMLGNIFIHNLLQSSTHMSFPLPLDEVASISHDAIEKNINNINLKGHTIVGITTHGSSGAFTQLFTNHLIMDAKKTALPYTKQRRGVVFVPELTEAIYPQTQAELFAADDSDRDIHSVGQQA